MSWKNNWIVKKRKGGKNVAHLSKCMSAQEHVPYLFTRRVPKRLVELMRTCLNDCQGHLRWILNVFKYGDLEILYTTTWKAHIHISLICKHAHFLFHTQCLSLSLSPTQSQPAPAAERESYSDKQLSYSRVGRKSITLDNKIAIEFL